MIKLKVSYLISEQLLKRLGTNLWLCLIIRHKPNIGTHQDAYSVAPDVRIRALELVEEGKLSERGLIEVLGV